MQQDLRNSPTKPHVLISGVLPPPMGGMAAYYQTLLNSSLPKQVDIHFIQTSSQKRELSSTGRVTLLNLIYAIKDCGRFTWALIRNRVQIAHIGTSAGLSFLKNSYFVFCAKIFGSYVLLHPHCSLSFIYHERSKLWQWYFRQVIRRTNGVVVLSKEWLQLNEIIPGCKVYYLPNGIDLKLYHNIANQNSTQAGREGPIRALYLGYIGKLKGSFDLLSTALNIRTQGTSMIFNLVGAELAPGELGVLREQVKKLKLEDIVKIYAPANGSDKLDCFRGADIFIYPSYYEGMPMAVLEAMACGLPIVASRVGGLPDLIQDGINGILVEPGKPEQLAAALCILANDVDLRASMGKASYQIAVEQYDIEQHVAELVHIYKNTIISSMSQSNHNLYE